MYDFLKTIFDKIKPGDSLQHRLEQTVLNYQKSISVYKELTSEKFDSIPDADLPYAIESNISLKMKDDLSDEAQIVDKLSKAQQFIYVVSSVEREVNHGGFDHLYFYHSYYAEKAAEAFAAINASKFSKLLNTTNSIWFNPKAKSEEGVDLNGFNSQFYSLYKDESLGALKAAYIREHKSDFLNA